MERVVVETAETKTGQYKTGGGSWSQTIIQTSDGKTFSGFESDCPGIHKVTRGAIIDIEVDTVEKGGKTYNNIKKFEMVREGEKPKTSEEIAEEQLQKEIRIEGGAALKAGCAAFPHLPLETQNMIVGLLNTLLEAYCVVSGLEWKGPLYPPEEAPVDEEIPWDDEPQETKTPLENLWDEIRAQQLGPRKISEEFSKVFGPITPTRPGVEKFINALDAEGIRKARKIISLMQAKEIGKGEC